MLHADIRPVPWTASDESVEAFGREAATRLMGAAYVTNAAVEGSSLSLVIVCIVRARMYRAVIVGSIIGARIWAAGRLNGVMLQC